METHYPVIKGVHGEIWIPNKIQWLDDQEILASEFLNDATKLRAAMRIACKGGNVQILHAGHYNFQPHGITGWLVLAESHFVISTWPEFSFLSVDIVTCGAQTNPEGIFKHFRDLLSGEGRFNVLDRSFPMIGHFTNINNKKSNVDGVVCAPLGYTKNSEIEPTFKCFICGKPSDSREICKECKVKEQNAGKKPEDIGKYCVCGNRIDDPNRDMCWECKNDGEDPQ